MAPLDVWHPGQNHHTLIPQPNTACQELLVWVLGFFGHPYGTARSKISSLEKTYIEDTLNVSRSGNLHIVPYTPHYIYAQKNCPLKPH